MIALAIVALIGGAIAWNVRGALMRQRFLTEVALVVERLRLAQEMMLFLGADMHVHVQEEEGGLVLFLYSESSLKAPWDRVINNSKVKLREVHSVTFVDEINPQNVQGKLDILFLSKGSVMSGGEMLLSTHDNPFAPGAITRAICLLGAPHVITSKPKIVITPTCILPTDKALEEKIIIDTVDEVLAK